jgi:mono/diheme cytochrome c family protein
MRTSRFLGAAAFACVALYGVSLYAGSEHPSALFKQYCAKCHGEDGTGNTPKGKQLMARDFTDAEFQAAKTNTKLVKTVTEGDEDMPPFGKKLSKEQIESLVKSDVRGFAPKK